MAAEVIITKPFHLPELVDLFSLPAMDLIPVYCTNKMHLRDEKSWSVPACKSCEGFAASLEPVLSSSQELLQQLRAAHPWGLAPVSRVIFTLSPVLCVLQGTEVGSSTGVWGKKEYFLNFKLRSIFSIIN